MPFIKLESTFEIVIFVIFALFWIFGIGIHVWNYFKKPKWSKWITPAFATTGLIFGLIIGALANYPSTIKAAPVWFLNSYDFIAAFGLMHITLLSIVCVFWACLGSFRFFFYNQIHEIKNIKQLLWIFALVLVVALGSANLLRVINANRYDSEILIATNLRTLGQQINGFSIWFKIASFLPSIFKGLSFSIAFIIVVVLSSFVGVIGRILNKNNRWYSFSIVNAQLSKVYEWTIYSAVFTFIMQFSMVSPIGLLWNYLTYLAINFLPWLIVIILNMVWVHKWHRKQITKTTLQVFSTRLYMIKTMCASAILASAILGFVNEDVFFNIPLQNVWFYWVTMIIMVLVVGMILHDTNSALKTRFSKTVLALGTTGIIQGVRTNIFVPAVDFLVLIAKMIYLHSCKLQRFIFWDFDQGLKKQMADI